MRRVLLLVLLALVLPAPVLANTISTGTLIVGTRSLVTRNSIGGFSLGNFRVQVQGTANTIEIISNPLMPPETGLSTGCVDGRTGTAFPQMCTFGVGLVDINPTTSSHIALPVTDGVVTLTSSSTATVTAILEPNSTVTGLGLGPGVLFTIDFASCPTPSCPSPTPPLNRILSGAAVVGTPEPSTLCLLGTNVIGLAGMVRLRRRLKLGT